MEVRLLGNGVLLLALCLFGLAACDGSEADPSPSPDDTGPQVSECILVDEGFGPQGTVEARAEEVVTGLEVPWGLAFLPNGGMLISERSGELRLVENGQLRDAAIATVSTADGGEGGLLDVALHPDFASNRFFYIYYTAETGEASVNRVERWHLTEDRGSASADQVILDDIPAARFHNGGRLRFGPDDMLYVGTGDAGNPQTSQDTSSLAGKLLRITPEGDVPDDNPFSDSPVYVTGIRNTQGFDWPDDATIWLTDHGPSGEMGRTGHDEVSVASAGANLGWPTIYGCRSASNLVTPVLSWVEAVPPGGAAIYTGSTISEWEGSLLVGTLGSEHLHRVEFEEGAARIQRHEVYFQGELGRLRTLRTGPDGELYVTTSNCDGRGSCPPDGDKVLRITR